MNAKIRIAIFVVVALGLVGYRALFVDQDEVGDFNNELVGMVQKSDESFGPFVEYLTAYANHEEVSVNGMQNRRNILEASNNKFNARLASMTVPDCELCKEFHAGCVAYLENSRLIIAKYKDVIAYMSEHNPPQEGDQDKVDEMLADLIEQDDAMSDNIAAIQKRVAQKYSLTLE